MLASPNHFLHDPIGDLVGVLAGLALDRLRLRRLLSWHKFRAQCYSQEHAQRLPGKCSK